MLAGAQDCSDRQAPQGGRPDRALVDHPSDYPVLSQDSPPSPPSGGEPRPLDVLIIGGGPAGVSTALHLLQLDVSWAGRMLLIEKQTHPRHKLCGGGLTYFGLRILQGLGFRLPLPIPQARVEDLRIRYKGWTVHARGYPLFVVYPRAELDHYLVRAAGERGVEVHQDERALSIRVEEGGVLVETDRARYLAQTVVGADGSKGLSRRAVYGDRVNTRVGRTLEVVLPAPETAPHFSQAFALFDFTPLARHLQGYAWDFPSRLDGAPAFNRGVYDARFYRRRPRAALPALLQDWLATLDDPQRLQAQGHPIHLFSPRNRFSAPRLLLVGDAAGADPLFGEGIAPALGYGAAAADAIRDAFARGDFSYRDYRRRLLASPVGRYLLLRFGVAWWSYRLCRLPGFMPALWAAATLLSWVLPKPRVEG